MLIADFNLTFFLKILEVIKLVQKAKLNSAEREKFVSGYNSYFKFVEGLMAVDFNNRSEEAEYK